MQTQCPHCETQFRITEEQYQIADGLVRCGVCNETFNAFEVNQDATSLPLDYAVENDEANDEAELASPENENINEAAPKEPVHADNIDTSTDINHAIEHDANHEAPSQPDAHHSEQNETEFDLFQTEDDETLSPDLTHSIVPEEYITENSHAVLTGVLWSFAILFLSFTLVAEYLWFNRNQLIQIPQAKPWVERLCQLTNCELAALRDPGQIELLTRNIYSHPNQKNTLIVAVTLVNHANFAQPYPDMQINFSDVRGEIIAARRFSAETYLQTKQEQLRLLAPESPGSFTMIIQDPGKQAMTYEFDFL